MSDLGHKKGEFILKFDSGIVSDTTSAVISLIDSAMDSEPHELALDRHTSERIRQFVSQKKKTVEIVLDANLFGHFGGSANVLMGPVGRSIVPGLVPAEALGELQEYRRALDDATRSLTKNLKDLDLLVWAGANVLVAEAKQYDVDAPDEQRAQVAGGCCVDLLELLSRPHL